MTTKRGQEIVNNAAKRLGISATPGEVPRRLRAALATFPLDDDLVIFAEEAQRLVGLNPAAAFIFRAMHIGTPLSELPDTLVREGLVGPVEANNWVKTTVEALSCHGMFEDIEATVTVAPTTLGFDPKPEELAQQMAGMPPYESFVPVTERSYGLLETRARIRFGDPGQLPLVDGALGHLATENVSEPTVIIDLPATRSGDVQLRSAVYRNGVPVGYAAWLRRLTPVVKGLLWSTAVNAHDFLFYFHAGVVGIGDSCLLLPAAAGSGKSSLTAALCHSGFDYFSDEVALIERATFQVPRVPLSICVKDTGWELMSRYFPHIWDLPAHIRVDKKRLRYVAPPVHGKEAPALPVSHIIFPRYRPNAPTELRAVPRREALSRLLEECLAVRRRLDRDIVESIIRWVGKIDCFTLSYSSLDEAVARIRQTVDCAPT